MTHDLQQQLRNCLPNCGEDAPQYVTEFVQVILSAAREARSSDVHWVPFQEHLEMGWRIDGVMQPVQRFSGGLGRRVVARLKVLSDLLT